MTGRTAKQRNDLKGCPFCKTAAVEIEHGAPPFAKTSGNATGRRWHIQCVNPFCPVDCQTRVFATLSGAEHAWQNRAE